MTNIMLNEYHKFSYKDKYFILNVEDMKAYRINKTLYNEITDLSQNIDTELKQALISLNLLKKITCDEKFGGKNDEMPPISGISLNVTQTCNMKCIYCYGGDGEYGEKGVMNQKIAYNSVDFLFKNSGDKKNVRITFFGGEPLLNFSLIKKVVNYAKVKATSNSKKISFNVITNGTMFTEEIIEYLNQNNIGVQVSLDGNKEIQDKNRPMKNNISSFDYIIPNLRKFIKSRNGNVHARATLTKYSGSKSDVSKYLKELGFKRIILSYVTSSEKMDFSLSKKKYRNIYEEIEKSAEEFLSKIKYRVLLEDNVILENLIKLFSKRKSYFTCGAGKGLVSISKSGKVYPCQRFVGNDNYIIGDSQKIDNNARKLFVLPQIKTSEVCSKCWARYLCGGNCYQENLEMTGSISNPYNSTCEIIKKNIETSIYIYDNMDKNDREFFKYKKNLIKNN